MAFKINISTKSGKTFKLEAEGEALPGKELHDKIPGKDVSNDLDGYEFEITGASDKAGFTAMENVEGIGLKKVLMTYGKGMNKQPKKEGKKKHSRNRRKGLKLRKTVRGKVISPEIVQINLKILKEGSKKLEEIFPEQNKVPEPEVKEEPKIETPKEKKPQEIPKEEVKQEPVQEKKEVEKKE